MSKKLTPEDVGDLAIYGGGEEAATGKFCDILNEFLAHLKKWRLDHSSFGAGDTASKEAQRDVINQILA